MKTYRSTEQAQYIQTPQRSGGPVRIDSILEARMRTFLRARRLRRFTFFA